VRTGCLQQGWARLHSMNPEPHEQKVTRCKENRPLSGARSFGPPRLCMLLLHSSCHGYYMACITHTPREAALREQVGQGQQEGPRSTAKVHHVQCAVACLGLEQLVEDPRKGFYLGQGRRVSMGGRA